MWPEQRGVKAQPSVEKAPPTPAKTSNLFGPKSTVDVTPPTSNIFGPKPTLDAKTNDKSVPKPTPTSTGFFGSTAAVDPDQPWAIVRHHCCLQDLMNPLLDEVEAKIAGLKLADFARP